MNFFNQLRLTMMISTSLLALPASEARVIQILHTNDLHSALQTAGAPRKGEIEYGGWPQLKAKLDELKADAKAKGWETLQLDAGDFSEGTVEYFPDRGTHVLRAFQRLGFDAAVIGNHDWLMGAREMDALYGEVPFPFPLLSANIKLSKSLKNLRSQIHPSVSIDKGGIKVGVFGLSTDESLYSWIAEVESRKNDFKIVSYYDTEFESDEVDESTGEARMRIIPGIASRLISELRKENDLVIALTHIGVGEDRYLAANSSGLDLIIGGHSHTVLDSLNYTQDRDGREVPIVQTGFNGKYIGKVIVDVEPGMRPKVLFYELVPVPYEGPKDQEMIADLKTTEEALLNQYGSRLNEVIGTSETRLVSGDSGPTAFSKFAVDSMRDVTQADIAIDIGAFHGNTPQPAGNVTRQNLMMMYPRKFEIDQNEGLYVYMANVPGIVLKIGLEYGMKFGTFISTSGITYDIKKLSDEKFTALKKEYEGSGDEKALTPYYPENIKINGEPLKALRWYSVAAPESLVRGFFGITPLAGLVLRRAHPTQHTIWNAMNYYLLKTGTIKKLNPDEHFNIKEVSNSYRKKYGSGHDSEQFNDDESCKVPWSNEEGSPKNMIQTATRAMIREMKNLGIK